MKKNKIKCSILLVLLFITYFRFNYSYASINYNFYIKNDREDSYNMLLADTVMKNTLIDNKIAPGTKGNFKVNVKIENGLVSKYKLYFNNFASNLPKNLKFYFNDEEIDLKTFSLIDVQRGKDISYLFSWKWEYETVDKKTGVKFGDIDDTSSAELGNLKFNIVLEAEYENEINKSKITLPRSGDI